MPNMVSTWSIHGIEIIWKWCVNILEMSKKSQEDISFGTGDIPTFV